MPVVVSTAVILTGQQIGEAVHFIGKLFNVNELEQLVRTKLDLDLFGEVAARTAPLETIAFDLIAYLLRHSLVGEFLDAMVTARPNNESLRLFVGRVKGGQGGTTSADQAEAFRSAIGAVTEVVKADPLASQMVGASKARFEITRDELNRLARYKALHDCLHTVQLQIVAISRAAKAFPADASAGWELTTYCDQLDRLAKRARGKTTGLLSEQDELAWVDEFDQARIGARGAVKASTSLSDAITALARLLPEAVRINGEMIGAAKRLGPGLDGLADTLDTLTRQLLNARRSDGVVTRMLKGTEALHELIPQLAGLTSTHDTWQKVEMALTAAETAPPASPAVRVPRWAQIKKLLPRVCPPGSAADATTDPVALADQWEEATELIARENLFIALMAAARHEFKDVDDRLLELAGELADTISPLDTLLQVI
jgi:hypothetical protein